MNPEHHPYSQPPEAPPVALPAEAELEQVEKIQTPELQLLDQEIDRAVDRILASGVIPPPEVVPTGEVIKLNLENMDEELTKLEQLADTCYEDQSFATFPSAVVIECDPGAHLDRIAALSKKLQQPIHTAHGTDRIPLSGFSVGHNYYSKRQLRKILKEAGVNTSEVVDTRLLQGAQMSIRQKLSFKEYFLAERAENNFSADSQYHPGNTSLPLLLARHVPWSSSRFDLKNQQELSENTEARRIDVFVSSMRSGTEYGLIVKGFFKGLQEQGYDLLPPYFMPIWEKLRNASGGMYFPEGKMMSEEGQSVLDMLTQYPTFGEYEDLEKRNRQEWDTLGEKGTLGVRRPAIEKYPASISYEFKEVAATLYRILDEVTIQLQQAVDQRGPSLHVGVFDESRSTGQTIRNMDTLVRAALNRIQRQHPETAYQFTTEQLDYPEVGGFGTEIETWGAEGRGTPYSHAPDKLGNRVNERRHNTRFLRPSKTGSPRDHAQHRIMLALMQEVGQIESRFLDQVTSEQPAITFQQKFMHEIERLYAKPTQKNTA